MVCTVLCLSPADEDPTPPSLTDEEPTSGPDVLVFQKAIPIMVLEVKTLLAVDIYKIKEYECIELLIYSLYIMRLHERVMRLHGRDSNLGILTWHILKLRRQEKCLKVEAYYMISSDDDKMVVHGEHPQNFTINKLYLQCFVQALLRYNLCYF